MDSSVMLRLRKLVSHAWQGTLVERLKWGAEEGRKRAAWERNRAEALRRKEAWRAAQQSGEHLEVSIEGGARLRLEAGNRLSENIYLHDFEIRERGFVERYLRRGDVFVDVGANIGLYTVIAAKCVGVDGIVYSFEPAAETRAKLRENVSLNALGNVRILDLALSDSIGRATLIVPSNGFDAWASLGAPSEGAALASETVATISWDEFCRTTGPVRPVTMMKIDVEGWECRVLDGATRALSAENAPLLQVEFTDAAAISAGSSCAALYSRLESLGYTVCRFDNDAKVLLADELRAEYPFENLYATKNLDADNRRLAGADA